MLKKEEWIKRLGKGGTEATRNQSGSNLYSKEGRRGGRDRSKIRCFNCGAYGHYATEFRKPRRDKEKDQKPEVNLSLTQDDEPALLFTECEKEETKRLLLNEGGMVPKLSQNNNGSVESNVWYLDNGASII